MFCVRRQGRAEYKLKNRQPLASLYLACEDEVLRGRVLELAEVIAEELNVKQVVPAADASELSTLSLKPNFKLLGPRLGPLMKKAGPVIQNLSAEQVARLAGGDSVPLELDGQPFELQASEVEVVRMPKAGMAVSAAGGFVVGLDTQLTEALEQEGLAREFVNKVQTMRKAADLDVVQRIEIAYAADETVQRTVEAFRDYIEAETLTTGWRPLTQAMDGISEWDLNGCMCRIAILPQP